MDTVQDISLSFRIAYAVVVETRSSVTCCRVVHRVIGRSHRMELFKEKEFIEVLKQIELLLLRGKVGKVDLVESLKDNRE